MKHPHFLVIYFSFNNIHAILFKFVWAKRNNHYIYSSKLNHLAAQHD